MDNEIPNKYSASDSNILIKLNSSITMKVFSVLIFTLSILLGITVAENFECPPEGIH